MLQPLITKSARAMTRYYVAFNSELHDRIFYKSSDFVPNQLWMNFVAGAIHEITGDVIFSHKINAPNFKLSTASGKKLTAYVRFCQESRTVCLGVEQGGKHGYTDHVIKHVVDQAFKNLMMPTEAPPAPTTLPPPRPVAIADFTGDVYGHEYISFVRGDLILPLRSPCGVGAQGWAYGENARGARGWYPPMYVQYV